jgi:hypothetical protein
MDLQQPSVICYHILHHKSNYQIQARLYLACGKDALCWRSGYVGHLLSEREDIRRRQREVRKDLARSFFGCSFQLLGEKSSRFMSRNRPGMFVPRNIFLLALGKWVSDFSLQDGCLTNYRPNWRRKESQFVKRCCRFWKNSIHNKRIILLRVTNAKFTGMITIMDNQRQIVWQCLLESI